MICRTFRAKIGKPHTYCNALVTLHDILQRKYLCAWHVINKMRSFLKDLLLLLQQLGSLCGTGLIPDQRTFTCRRRGQERRRKTTTTTTTPITCMQDASTKQRSWNSNLDFKPPTCAPSPRCVATGGQRTGVLTSPGL